MNPTWTPRPRRALALLLGLALPLLGPSPGRALAQSAVAPLARVAATPRAAEARGAAPSGVRVLQVRAASGRPVAALQPEGRGLRVLAGDTRFSAPRYQRWHGSEDGRTLLGAGDPRAPEHPFELRFAVWRDGIATVAPGPVLDPESAFTVGADGSIGLVGHPPGERDAAFAALLEPDGSERFRVALPAGLQAADPVLAAGSLLLRTAPRFAAAPDAPGHTIWRASVAGLEPLAQLESAQELVDLGRSSRVLVRTSDALLMLEAASGAVLWRARQEVRPSGPGAWALGESEFGLRLAVLSGGLRRAGQPAPRSRVLVFDAADGSSLGELLLADDGPAPLGGLFTTDDRLTLERAGAREDFRWTR